MRARLRGRLTHSGALALSAALLASACVMRRERGGARVPSDARTFMAARQLQDTGALRVRVQLPFGTVRVGAARPSLLYDMMLRYDERRGRIAHRYDAATRTLTVGVPEHTITVSSSRHDDDGAEGSELRLGLAPRVPVDLELAVGAAEATLDLGGLAVTDLRVKTGASASTLRWRVPNTARMRALVVQAGAAGVKAVSLANANAADVRVHGGVCDVDLDLGGALAGDMNVDTKVGLGRVSVRIPPGVAARVAVEKFLASVDVANMERRGDAYYTAGYDTAPHKINVRAKIVLGSIEIDH
jgi:hypothetical protein